MDLPLPLRLLRYTLRIAYVIVTNFMAIPAYITWMILLYPVKCLAPNIFWTIEPILFKGLLAFVTFWISSGGYRMIESGDQLDGILDAKTILLVNHQSTSDVPVVMSSFQPKGLATGHMMWIMDYVFKFTNFGWISHFHGDFFIQQGKVGREEQLSLLGNHLKTIFKKSLQKWIILYPEGGFLRKRRKRSQAFAKKYDYPVLQHVTLPRLGAIQVVINTLCENNHPAAEETEPEVNHQSKSTGIKWIVDMTIGYPGAEPLDLHGMCIGYWAPRDISVHYRIYPIKEVPTHNTQLFTCWLYDRYHEKDQFLEEFYTNSVNFEETDKENRKFPRMERRSVDIDPISLIFFHFFYATSTYIFWCNLYSPILSLVSWCLAFVF
ncbi:acyl-CoA:lysophosphatidylglycerol acyltransferase 1-like [Mizuhopecten yessoensis]|uniref:Acyl-CoA:lysophosphatidylglycerol acyltransferase 1 n=1 Tax=Mizuhopecten yessoensis TaxID=6573 RepID=A0A210Q4T4_MIZYE|nr:acyl-CoA:lysophosphatidylglycerol acyltransferase 1-like [Mizuhopecten yessoensis]OWF43753.1 Acyl-CoA:lysophosphatidylglycerol acyltransferase 1 [Mizuhopecten yessoensis]